METGEELQTKGRRLRYKGLDLAKYYEIRKQSEEVKKKPLSKKMVVDPEEASPAPSRNAALTAHPAQRRHNHRIQAVTETLQSILRAEQNGHMKRKPTITFPQHMYQ